MFYRSPRRRKTTFKAPVIQVARPADGFTNESNDCAVLSLANVLCISYAEAHKLCADAGRKPRDGTYHWQTERAITAAGYKFERRDEYTYAGGFTSLGYTKRVTAANIVEHLPKRGHFYVSTGYHAFAVVDGVIYDNTALKPRCRVRYVLEILV